jgi:hypothetical protein
MCAGCSHAYYDGSSSVALLLMLLFLSLLYSVYRCNGHVFAPL